MDKYDSREDTKKHIKQVQDGMENVIQNLKERSLKHDLSKLESPQKQIFDQFTPKLKNSVYGSDQYKTFLVDMKVGLSHHYLKNSHHPEHFENGIKGMSLLDILQMLVDWRAATLRHSTGDLMKSIQINQERFGYTDQMKQILINTAKELGYIN